MAAPATHATMPGHQREGLLAGAARLRSWHGGGAVRVQGERGPQVLDGPLLPLRRPDRGQPAWRLPVADQYGAPGAPQ
jgi:hypothetical protein